MRHGVIPFRTGLFTFTLSIMSQETQAPLALSNLLSRGYTMAEARRKLGIAEPVAVLDEPVEATPQVAVKAPVKEPQKRGGKRNASPEGDANLL